MFNPTIILAALVAALLTLSGGFAAGNHWAVTKHEAALAQQQREHMAEMDRQRAHADELSNALSIAEGRVITKTVEVIKYVPKVTTGAPCLNAATVSLLQPGSDPSLRPPSVTLTTEGASPASSDTDVAYWIAEANRHYETCALRLNTLIDFEMSSK